MKRKMPAARIVLSRFALFFLLVSPPSATYAQQVIPRIINGEPTDEFPAVGIVGAQSAGGFCSGTLISPTHVLTAGHCAEYLLSFDGQTGGTFQLNDKTYTTSRVILHPQYNSNTLANDIAILELSTPVTDVQPAKIYRQAPQVGQQLTLVGYGAGGDGASGEDGMFGEKMVGVTTLEKVEATKIIWVFDSENESNTAPGDSGGPAFVDVQGEYFIAGVTSSGTESDAGLGDVAADTRVDAYAVWIDSIVGAQEEPPPEDGDDQTDQENPGDVVNQMCHAWLSRVINWFMSYVSDRFFFWQSPTALVGHHHKPSTPAAANNRPPVRFGQDRQVSQNSRAGQNHQRPATVPGARSDKEIQVQAGARGRTRNSGAARKSFNTSRRGNRSVSRRASRPG